MSRRIISLVAVLSLFLFACAGLPELTGAATPTIPPDLPPLEIATEMPVATVEETGEPTEPEVTDEVPTDEPTEDGSEEPTDEAPDEPTEAPLLDLITSDEASKIVMLKELEMPGVAFIAINPDADMMASAEGNTINLINMPWPAGAVKLEGHTGKVNAVSWAPDSTQIASASDDGTVRLWDIEEGTEASKFDVGSGGVSTVAWSPDGTLIAAGAKNGSVQVLDATSGELTLTIDAGKGVPVSALSWSSDGIQLAVAIYGGGSDAGSVQIWDATTGDPGEDKPAANFLAPGPTGIAWSPYEDLVAWVNNKDVGHVALWEIGGEKTLVSFTGQSKVATIAWNPDGDMIASGGFDHTVQVWLVEDGTALAKLTGHKDTIQTVAWSPDGSYIVSADASGSVRIWGIVTAE